MYKVMMAPTEGVDTERHAISVATRWHRRAPQVHVWCSRTLRSISWSFLPAWGEGAAKRLTHGSAVSSMRRQRLSVVGRRCRIPNQLVGLHRYYLESGGLQGVAPRNGRCTCVLNGRIRHRPRARCLSRRCRSRLPRNISAAARRSRRARRRRVWWWPCRCATTAGLGAKSRAPPALLSGRHGRDASIARGRPARRLVRPRSQRQELNTP